MEQGELRKFLTPTWNQRGNAELGRWIPKGGIPLVCPRCNAVLWTGALVEQKPVQIRGRSGIDFGLFLKCEHCKQTFTPEEEANALLEKLDTYHIDVKDPQLAIKLLIKEMQKRQTVIGSAL